MNAWSFNWSISAMGIIVLPVSAVIPYILYPQHIHKTKIALVLRLEWSVSPSHSTILDGNISQATHSDILELLFLSVEARLVQLFDTLASGSLLSLGKFSTLGVHYTSILKKVYILFQGKILLQVVISTSNTFLWKLNKDNNYYQENK